MKKQTHTETVSAAPESPRGVLTHDGKRDAMSPLHEAAPAKPKHTPQPGRDAELDKIRLDRLDRIIELEAERDRLREQVGELHRLWDASAAEARRNKEQVKELLAAARGVESRSHWNNDVYGYVVDKGAMDRLCVTIGKIGKRVDRATAKAEGRAQ